MEGYLSQVDVARRLGIDQSLLRYYQRMEILPPPTWLVGKRLYYQPSEWAGIQAAFEAKERKPYTWKTQEKRQRRKAK